MGSYNCAVRAHLSSLAIGIAVAGCWASHVSEEGAAIVEEGEVRTCERLSGCSALETRVPVGDDGCLLFTAFACGGSTGHVGRLEPYALEVESNLRSVGELRFYDGSCRDWGRERLEGREPMAAPAQDALGWLRAIDEDSGLRVAGDITFVGEDAIERRVIIREQRLPLVSYCP